ncbi:hypothetical protein [Leptospira saintgironsiae]|uniref:Uncharacterized protein n=1 Tax=Leptospira saintgironsiae TaxID=2023183 RepID=A0A2M9YGE8_9LEPT|nr:hypothetical protein [Leptospira saintgironsiae]PJZ50617.1 hypothetical protein CH362_02300 [Leptospira saintgironsiae]
MKVKLFSFSILLCLALSFPFFLGAQSESKTICLNWEKNFPKIDSKLYLEISGLELILSPPTVAIMRSRRPGELVPIIHGSYKTEGNKEVLVEFPYEPADPDECSFSCKEQSLALRANRNTEEVYDSCFKSCRNNTSFKFGKDKFKLHLKFKIYRDETDTLRIDSVSYKDLSPITGKLAYSFPHYFAGDLVECGNSIWD